MKAYAICDTDGGRVAPFPLLRHIYATEQEAKQNAAYLRFDPEYYPVLPVKVSLAAHFIAIRK